MPPSCFFHVRCCHYVKWQQKRERVGRYLSGIFAKRQPRRDDSKQLPPWNLGGVAQWCRLPGSAAAKPSCRGPIVQDQASPFFKPHRGGRPQAVGALCGNRCLELDSGYIATPGGAGAASCAAESVELGAAATGRFFSHQLIALARRRDRGVYGELESTLPASSPIIWTSIATSQVSAKHGIC